ncbi:hypothetical protein Patl1_32028 [Pistacia atlantica]|uniref:Uncharacterized protein n=1 Tax=Pistacia atlantica TaxID=434234 RepID=A0ACC1AQ83_9ROSI|nr:hypothetical protein Patl1_32028 [Pistacia atlantica]
MDLHLVFKIILLVLLMKASSLVAYFPSNQRCNDSCGGVHFRYPFGMNEPCYFNEGFKINCNDSSGSFKPYLSGTNLEVLYMSLSSFRVSVNLPVFSSNCNKISTGEVVYLNKNSTGEVVDLSGSPFYFSDTANRFTATGCATKATIRDHMVAIGIGCCQIPIPPYLQVLNASIDSDFNQCGSAFISSNWRSIDVLKDEHVPAALNFWGRNVGRCIEKNNSMQPFCNGDSCAVQLSETHICLCDHSNSIPITNDLCQGTNLQSINYCKSIMSLRSVYESSGVSRHLNSICDEQYQIRAELVLASILGLKFELLSMSGY